MSRSTREREIQCLIQRVACLCMKQFIVISNLLKEISSLCHYIASIFLHCLLKKVLLSLFAILWNSAFRWVYIFLFLLCLSFLFFSQLFVNSSSDNHFAFSHFFFWGVVLITTSCIMLQTSIHSSSGTASIKSNPLNLFVTFTT